ncbi:endoplasmic reticulum protein [Kwoniella heveanensis BCC8398]|uniref:Endoplasmic reticulum protein n=1 Tax=Kwoniella heveanensis BCC8398 TaxID=1296120 RepID=A0A1B9GJS7_9TREE|nr:endoplasmic reticulum protein [Kwoniella heveanensis BCC8398]
MTSAVASSSPPTPVTLVGATGLTGSRSLSSILASSHPFNLTVLTRRSLPAESAPPPANNSTTLQTRLYTDLFDAPTDGQKIAEQGGVYVSCLGTTRANAGGTAQQEKVDLHLNRDLAKRAKDDGASTMILVSTSGASSASRMFYPRIKGELEDAVKEMGFEHAVILRPAALLGPRNESRPAEYIMQSTFRGLRKLGLPLTSLCIDAEDVGACIAHLAAHPPADKVVTLWDDEIIAFARKYREENSN